jgi:hypothetical protein
MLLKKPFGQALQPRAGFTESAKIQLCKKVVKQELPNFQGKKIM